MAESAMSEVSPPKGFRSSSMKNGAVTTDMMQVVNYEEEFNVELGPFLERNQIAGRGFDYNVTAIMGPQSSGKSTLLNLLFGTEFRTMDAKSGRYQVTQGVWLGRDDCRGIIVMDLEGTDSRERGEDAASYERKSALFALALAEVLIVNIWTQDVGRFNAANLQLLKTVMELDLQLFFSGEPSSLDTPGSPKREAHKTRLLFVLRDHVSTPLEALEATLRADINDIWEGIAKPEAVAGTDIEEYFDLTFFALPHKVLMAKEFAEKAAELRTNFMEGDMFLEEYRRDVAADGFATYADSVWNTIRDNKELDIPTQKEMLAHVRCEEISREAIDAAQIRLDPLQKVLSPNAVGSTETVPKLFETLQSICDEATKHYDAGAYRYAKKVAALKGQDLREKLGNDCKELFDTQIAIASQNAMKSFEKRLFKRKSTSPKNAGKNAAPWENWGAVSAEAKLKVLEEFDAECAIIPLEASGDETVVHPLAFAQPTVSAARQRLGTSLDTELGRATGEATTKARDFCLKTFQDAFKPSMSSVLDNAADDVWERTSEVAATSWEKTKQRSENVFGSAGLGLDEEALETAVEDDLKPECLDKSFADIKDLIGTPNTFLNRMTKRFEDKFRFDEQGIPRTFGPADDLNELFVEARTEAEKLIDLLGEIKLTGPLTRLRDAERSRSLDDEDEPVLFEAHTKSDLRERLQRQAGVVFMEARRAQEASKITTRVPIWLFVALIVLGWNELMAVFRNPVLFMLLAICIPLLYLGYYSEMGGVVLIPAMRAMAGPIIQQAQDMLDQQGIGPIAGPPAGNGTAVPPPSRADDAGKED